MRVLGDKDTNKTASRLTIKNFAYLLDVSGGINHEEQQEKLVINIFDSIDLSVVL